jgi:hypothetical protein
LVVGVVVVGGVVLVVGVGAARVGLGCGRLVAPCEQPATSTNATTARAGIRMADRVSGAPQSAEQARPALVSMGFR